MKKVFLIIALMLSSKPLFSQCAMCKAVVENGDSDMAEGINSGIIYLMIFPYLFLALGVYFLYRKYKKNQNL
ncbi:MAG: hypothetical protein V3U80_02465 [Flavobacteriaceae bacterium]